MHCKARCAFCYIMYVRGLKYTILWKKHEALPEGSHSENSSVSTGTRFEAWITDLTFGTRNWTVRDTPPSHEAISIIKPAKKI